MSLVLVGRSNHLDIARRRAAVHRWPVRGKWWPPEVRDSV